MRRLLTALPLLFALSAQAQQVETYAQAKSRADADESSLSSDASQALLASQGEILDEGVAHCATPNPDLTPFVVVVQLDERGQIVRTWREGSSPLAICVQKYLAGKALPAPLQAPFFTAFELSFTP